MSKPLAQSDQSPSPEMSAPPGPVSSPRSSSTGFASVLRNRAFLSIWIAQLTSQTAQNTLWYVLIIMVGHQTGQSTLSVGFTIILVQLPTVLFSSLSGVLVDRVPKRTILIGTNVIRVAGVMLYFLFQTHVELLYLVTFLVAVVSQPFAPAEGSTLPLLLDEEQLITANSLFQMTFMASQAVGFAIAPISMGLLGTSRTLIALASLFAVAALSLLLLPSITRVRKPTEDVSLREAAERVWHELAEATNYIVHDPPLALALFQIALAPMLLLVLAEVGQDYLAHGLGIAQTSTSLFFLLAPAGAGMAVGMLVLGQWGYRLRKDRLVLVALIALGLTVIGLAAVPLLRSFWDTLRPASLMVPQGLELTMVLIPVTALMGLEVAFINAPVQTIVQERAAPELRGRVLAMQQTLTAAIAIPPLVLVGGVAALIGTPATLTLMGLAIIVVGLAIVYYS